MTTDKLRPVGHVDRTGVLVLELEALDVTPILDLKPVLTPER